MPTVLETARPLSWRWLLALAPAAFAMALAAVFVAVRWPHWEEIFGSDGSPMAWLSSAQLLAGALLALRLGTERALAPWQAALLAAGLGWLALDEQFLLHEQWKYGCVRWWSACTGWWLRELPMLAVAVFGGAFLLRFWRAVPDGLARTFTASALAVGWFALWLDLAGMPQLLAPLEELFEVLAEALFLGALLSVPPRQVHS